MSSVRCPQCQFINFANATSCKRCQAQLDPQQAGIVTEDGYVLPPPPPLAAGYGPAQGVWRSKSTLIMSKQAWLPGRCVKCNEPTDQRLKRKLTWHHPALYLLAPFALLIYAIVAMALRKTAIVQVPLCDLHLANRRRFVLITWALVLLAVGSFVAAGYLNDGTFILVGLLLFFGVVIFGIVTLRVVAPARIDDYYVWLTGVNRKYLEQLPPWPGA